MVLRGVEQRGEALSSAERRREVVNVVASEGEGRDGGKGAGRREAGGVRDHHPTRRAKVLVALNVYVCCLGILIFIQFVCIKQR